MGNNYIFQINADTEYCRRKTTSQLKCDLEATDADTIVMEHRIYIDLPPVVKHQGHLMGDVSTPHCLVLSINTLRFESYSDF